MAGKKSQTSASADVLAEFGLREEDISSSRESQALTWLNKKEYMDYDKFVVVHYRDSANSKKLAQMIVSQLQADGYKTAVIKNFSKIKNKIKDSISVFQLSKGRDSRQVAILAVKHE